MGDTWVELHATLGSVHSPSSPQQSTQTVGVPVEVNLRTRSPARNQNLTPVSAQAVTQHNQAVQQVPGISTTNRKGLTEGNTVLLTQPRCLRFRACVQLARDAPLALRSVAQGGAESFDRHREAKRVLPVISSDETRGGGAPPRGEGGRAPVMGASFGDAPTHTTAY